MTAIHRRDAEAQRNLVLLREPAIASGKGRSFRRIAAGTVKVALLAVFGMSVMITTLLAAVASGVYGGAAGRIRVFTPVKLLDIWNAPFSPENLLR